MRNTFIWNFWKLDAESRIPEKKVLKTIAVA